jgi:hypothetical protein
MPLWVLRDGRILHQASNALPWPDMLAALR